MKILKLFIVLALVLGTTTIQAQTAFLLDWGAALETATPQHELTIDNMDGESVLILWESSTVGGFYEIERAEGDGTYTSIAQIDADGTSSFSFIDNEPYAENTYRLKHVSQTGVESYSDENYISLLSEELTLASLKTER